MTNEFVKWNSTSLLCISFELRACFEEDKQTVLPRSSNDANLSLPVLIAIAVCVSVEKEIEK